MPIWPSLSEFSLTLSGRVMWHEVLPFFFGQRTRLPYFLSLGLSATPHRAPGTTGYRCITPRRETASVAQCFFQLQKTGVSRQKASQLIEDGRVPVVVVRRWCKAQEGKCTLVVSSANDVRLGQSPGRMQHR